MNFPAERIVRLGEKDNFWQMGDTGPCGPCSEIIIDQGPEMSCGKAGCAVGCDCDRFLEIWNLVFMQYNRDESGTLTPLPKPSIDTGMGLERLSAVVRGVKSNFETDLFQPLIKQIAALAGVPYHKDRQTDISYQVIADHLRAMTFLISDGVLPSNEGRGYVLRRVIRRASRYGKLIGIDKPFLYKLTGVVVDEMRDAYPELVDSREHAAKVALLEEERFVTTLDSGLALLNETVAKLKSAGSKVITGDVLFKLYDTFGSPGPRGRYGPRHGPEARRRRIPARHGRAAHPGKGRLGGHGRREGEARLQGTRSQAPKAPVHGIRHPRGQRRGPRPHQGRRGGLRGP